MVRPMFSTLCPERESHHVNEECVGLDGLSAVYVTTYEINQKKGTNYHERFKKFLLHIQENDSMSAGAISDPRGDRSLKPHEQEDQDLYLRVVEKRKDGIIVRGAKAHIAGAINSHEIIVMPTRAMSPEDKDMPFPLPFLSMQRA